MPHNEGYYHAAYTVALIVYALYAIGLWRRRARVRGELARLGADPDPRAAVEPEPRATARPVQGRASL